MNEFVALIINQLIINQLINEDDKELYEYCMIITFEKILGFSVILLFAIKYELFAETLIFIIFFSNIRKHTNGLHFSNFATCFFTSIGIYIFYAKFIYPYLKNNLILNYTLLLFSIIILLTIGSVNSQNIDWTHSEQQKNTKIAKHILISETGLIIIFNILKIDNSFILFMSFGIILSAILLLIEKIRKEELFT